MRINNVPLDSPDDWEVVGEMTRPIPMRSVSRNEGCLQYAVYEPMPCGCKVTGNGSCPHPLTVKQCQHHSVDNELYGVLNALRCAFKMNHAEAGKFFEGYAELLPRIEEVLGAAEKEAR